MEALRGGDDVLALRGPALLPVRSIARGRAGAMPILIKAGALGDRVPRRDLCLAQDQPVFLEADPVPAEALVNGGSICRVSASEVELYVIDIGTADVLLAEGVPIATATKAAEPGHA